MIKLANAPCSWGVLEFDLEGKLAPYGKVLDEMRATGYQGTELGDWGFLPSQPNRLSQNLSKRDLDLIGAFVPVNLKNSNTHLKGLTYALKVAGLMYYAGYEHAKIVLSDDNGAEEERVTNAGKITPDMGLNSNSWEIFAEGVNKIAYAVNEAYGLQTVFHHHCAGYVETPDEIHTLLEYTDKGLVGLCLDTGHYCYGGGDPIAALTRYNERIWHIHLKDFDIEVAKKARLNQWGYFKSVQNGIFCELGKGTVNFKKFIDVLKAYNYSGWAVVEQDVLPGMGNPKQCAQSNREYLKGLGL
ncbi:MAG: xylose isomerase [Flammeovirgaceae bacterium]|nr:xylose isomerase [Flammeovirgaceae bacterium]